MYINLLFLRPAGRSHLLHWWSEGQHADDCEGPKKR